MIRHLAAAVVGVVGALIGWLLAMFPNGAASRWEQYGASVCGFSLGVLGAWAWQALVDRSRLVDRLVAGDVDNLDDLDAAFDREEVA